MEAKAFSSTHRTKVCAGGTVRKIHERDPRRTLWFLGGTRISDPISESEMGSEARRVVGQPNSTRSVVKAA